MADEETTYTLHYDGKTFPLSEREATQLKRWGGEGQTFTIQQDDRAVHLAIGPGIPFVLYEKSASAEKQERRVTILR